MSTLELHQSNPSRIQQLIGKDKLEAFIALQKQRKSKNIVMANNHSANIRGVIIGGVQQDARIVRMSAGGSISVIQSGRAEFFTALVAQVDGNPTAPLRVNDLWHVDVTLRNNPMTLPPTYTITLLFGSQAEATSFVSRLSGIIAELSKADSGNESGGSSPGDPSGHPPNPPRPAPQQPIQ